MRYLSLILFAIFLVFSVDFATQNTVQVLINYKIAWLNFDFITERPIFVPIFFSFAFGIVFSVIYFFISHAALFRKLFLKSKEIKKLERLLESERVKNDSSLKQGNSNQQNNFDNHLNNESFVVDDIDSDNLKK
tara:strand:- start:14 stop:415 length:402 start_codon:yes stop_codon:yes gene_type:complete